MAALVKWFATAFLVLAAFGGCSKLGGTDPMTWARAALDRNSLVEVVAEDTAARTFTVRVKASGELKVVPLDQLIAAPPPAGELAQPPATPEVASSGTSGTGSSAASQASPGGPAGTQQGGQPPASAPPESAASSESAVAAGAAQSAGPVSAGEAASQGDQAPHAQPATNAKAGSVLASGPGYSIEASGPRTAAARSSLVGATRGTPVERLHDPIICQGSRLLHIDNRNLEFDGDAVSAEDGCEIHITNSRIAAKGIGVQARAANVHISNSEIAGDSGAIDASEGAQVYAESSRFRGLTRRMESSAFHDLGGNVWN